MAGFGVKNVFEGADQLATLRDTFGAEVVASLATAAGEVKGMYLIAQLTGGPWSFDVREFIEGRHPTRTES